MDQKNLYFNKKKKKNSVETLNNMRKVMPSFILFLKKKKNYDIFRTVLGVG